VARKMAVKTKETKIKTGSVWQRTKLVAVGLNGIKSASRILLLISVLSLVYVSSQRIPDLVAGIWPVKNIQVVGDVERIGQSNIASLMAKTNSNEMLNANVNELKEELMKNPWIKMATVSKQWPDTLKFELLEYQPIALVNNKLLLESGEFVSDGIGIMNSQAPMNETTSPQRALIRLTKEGLSNTQSSEMVGANYLKLVSQFLAMKHQLNLIGLPVEEFLVDETNSWIIQLQDEKVIKLGRVLQQQRLDRFQSIYQSIDNRKQLKGIDLRYKNGLAVSYRNELTAKSDNG
jgi:cell division protein FtsQ